MIPGWEAYPLGPEDDALPAMMKTDERTGRPLAAVGSSRAAKL